MKLIDLTLKWFNDEITLDEFKQQLKDEFGYSFPGLGSALKISPKPEIQEFKQDLYSLFNQETIELLKQSKQLTILNLYKIYKTGFNHIVPKCQLCSKFVIPSDQYTYKDYKDLTDEDLMNEIRPLFCESCWRHNETALNIKKKIVKFRSIKKYGVDNPSKTEEAKEKISEYRKKHKDVEVKKRQETIRKKYGVDNAMFNPEIKKKHKERVSSEEHRLKVSEGLRKHYDSTQYHLQQFFEFLEENGYEILEPKKEEVHRKFDIKKLKHECGTIYEVEKPYDWYLLCPRCRKTYAYSSSYEEELINHLKEFGLSDLQIERNNKKLLGKYEIDILIPDKKLAIEFNGSYWHSDLFKFPDYHQTKSKLAYEKGYRLIHIYEHLWITDISYRIKVLDLIKYATNPDLVKVHYAKNVYFTEINSETYREFLSKYHIDGYISAPFKYGIFDKKTDNLIGVFSFSKHRFSKDKDIIELYRYAIPFDTKLVGGISKIIKFIKNQFPGKKIVTYVNFNYFTGESYRQSPLLKFAGYTQPNYWWVGINSYQYYSRYETQKHLLKDLLGDKFDPKKSESDNMRNAGFLKLYDAGNLRFETDN